MLKRSLDFCLRRILPAGVVLAAMRLGEFQACANPSGATVSQGTASFKSQGPQLTIQTSDRAYINWQSFNIGQGETTTFVQPSSSSLVWNHINDANPSQILGNLNANGYVVLQNQSGFYIGGQAAITAHGLIMTTAPIPMPDLSSSGPWDFNAPPPAAKIINYGQITSDRGGSVFLIANNIQNSGTISAPEGRIGLYAGKSVLVSDRPDGLGFSAQVTLPQGSVDNTGKLIADAGTIAVHAQVVNQGGLVQANSLREVNGAIELVAGDSLTLGPQSVISAQGDTQGTSPGGSVTLKSDNSYQDSSDSSINVSGGAQGGNGGQIEISASQFAGIQSGILGGAVPGWTGGSITLDPDYLDLVPGSGSSGTGSSASDPMLVGVDSYAGFASISLQAGQNLEIGSTLNGVVTSTPWSLPDSATSATLTLTAGNNIVIDDGSFISAGQNWTVNLNAGGAFVPTLAQPTPASGSYGIYLKGGGYIQTQNGDINLNAINEVQIATSTLFRETVGNNGVRTLGGGNITVTTTYGDVNTGSNPQGFNYQTTAPYYTVNDNLGGISTAAGGNVAINAGGNVYSFAPPVALGDYAASDINQDGGTGAFGPEPGNVTITAGNYAGGGVFGHYVLANGIGSITAKGGDVGTDSGDVFALSLITGTWTVNAPNGSIYLQEVRNPNGDFNNKGTRKSAGQHLFTYDPNAAVNLNAGIGVSLTGANVPRWSTDPVPVLYPSTLNIMAGSGGVTLENSVTLFPSPDGNLNITTTDGGNFVSSSTDGSLTPPFILMSDSSFTRWQTLPDGSTTFTPADHGAAPLDFINLNPVVIDIAGSMENVALLTTKETQITVGGDMINCGFAGQNLKPTDDTTINVGGQIFLPSAYSFVFVNPFIPAIPADDVPPGDVRTWDQAFDLALNPALLANVTVTPQQIALAQIFPSSLQAIAFRAAGVFENNFTTQSPNPGFVYNTATGRLGFASPGGPMSPQVLQEAQTAMVVLRYGANGLPEVDATGHFITDPAPWVSPAAVQTLYDESHGLTAYNDFLPAPSSTAGELGFRIGGPGEFDVTANSISLGNSYGILSCGVFNTTDPYAEGTRYENLASVTPNGGATIKVTTTGDLDMLTSTIATLGGGDVDVTSLNGSMDLGSQELFGTSRQEGFGVYTGGPGNVNVTAFGDIDIDGSRIAAFDGGNITVESQTGDVNAGSGGAVTTGVVVSFVNPKTGLANYYPEDVIGSGIVANTLVDPAQVPGGASQPGNITVTTPQGDINADLGGIVQTALNGNVAPGPIINLTAGTPASMASPLYIGNINLGDSGVIGGTVDLSATGDITGLVVSRQNSTVTAAQNASVTVLSGGMATVAATQGAVTGTIIAAGGVTASGGGGVTAVLLSQSVTVAGSTSSTLGTTAAASSAATAAAAQATDSAQQQVASTTSDDDDLLKKKGKGGPLLARRVGRVTVILPKG